MAASDAYWIGLLTKSDIVLVKVILNVRQPWIVEIHLKPKYAMMILSDCNWFIR